MTINDASPGHIQQASADLQRRASECGVIAPPPPPPSPTPGTIHASQPGQGNRLPGVAAPIPRGTSQRS